MEFNRSILFVFLSAICAIKFSLGASPVNGDSLIIPSKDSDVRDIEGSIYDSIVQPLQINEDLNYIKESSVELTDWENLINQSSERKSRKRQRSRLRNFYYLSSDDLSDGEHEVRLHFSGVSARQTSVGLTEGSEGGLVVREVSNGRQLLYMIYTGFASNVTTTVDDDTTSGDSKDILTNNPALQQHLVLKECNMDEDLVKVKEFVNTFKNESKEAQLLEEGSVAGSSPSWRMVQFTRVTAMAQLPAPLKEMIKFKALKRQCRKHHKNAKKAMKFAKKIQELKEEEKELEREQEEAVFETVDGDSFDDEDEHDNDLLADGLAQSRTRRSINDLFILPGTLWCGNEHRASSTRELSGHLDADACCRVHDFCPSNIPGLSTRYGLFNSNFLTMSHCGCDTRFRTCLKSSNTGAANLVGRIFFDMVRTECFMFVKKKVCKRKNWWGHCQKYRIQRRAILREPLPWTR